MAATDILLAWTGTVGLVLLLVGLGKAQNAKTKSVVSALAFLFWIVFTFGSYGVFVGSAADRERLTMFAFLGLILTLASFVLLVYNALEVVREAGGAPRRGQARA